MPQRTVHVSLSSAEVSDRIAALSARFASERPERQRRRHLDRTDFDELAAAGFLGTALPVEEGGLWDGSRSVRTTCELLRVLAQGDPSVALVASMHPGVVALWLSSSDEAATDHALAAQREDVLRAVRRGAWFGTITSEPGSGGDVLRTKATAVPLPDGRYAISGQKHFGSGSGITDYMLTSAVATGESAPAWFLVPVGGMPWDGSTGYELLAEWDGHGMIATQSHGMRFADVPAHRFAAHGPPEEMLAVIGPFAAAMFSAVIVGIVQSARSAARAQLIGRAGDLRSYEQVEWTRAETEAWLVDQAYERALTVMESGVGHGEVIRAKTAIAELAESFCLRLCRVLGGGTFARSSPFGNWFEDVRALGYLRPPWGLAYDRLFEDQTGT